MKFGWVLVEENIHVHAHSMSQFMAQINLNKQHPALKYLALDGSDDDLELINNALNQEPFKTYASLVKQLWEKIHFTEASH